MSQINWNQGQMITLNVGDTATCSGNLNHGQIYGLFFYNSALNDADTTVTVTGSNQSAPTSIIVPGTTANQGLASICFVYGSDTTTISAAVTNGQPGANITAFICSVKMPTNTVGINNVSLPTDGSEKPFNKFTRYYCVPKSTWHLAQVSSNMAQFMSVLFTEDHATLIIVDPVEKPKKLVGYYGNAEKHVTTKNAETASPNTVSWKLQGDGSQYVFMNADSPQDSETATISLQQLG
ncbi:MAG: hypothetical protein ACRCYO_04670 [Bacteroidia bacterium]